MGEIMKSKSLRMTLLSLSISALFIPNFAAAEDINGETTLEKGSVDKSDLVVSRGDLLQGSGDNETNLTVSSAGGVYALFVNKGGQISNFGQIRVNGNTKLINALRREGYGLSIIALKNNYRDKLDLIIVDVKSKNTQETVKLIKELDPKAFIVVKDTRVVHNGYIR